MKSLSLGSYFKWSSWLALSRTSPFPLASHLKNSLGVARSAGPSPPGSLYRAIMPDITWVRSQQPVNWRGNIFIFVLFCWDIPWPRTCGLTARQTSDNKHWPILRVGVWLLQWTSSLHHATLLEGSDRTVISYQCLWCISNCPPCLAEATKLEQIFEERPSTCSVPYRWHWLHNIICYSPISPRYSISELHLVW